MNDMAPCPMALLVQADFDGELDAVQAAEVDTHRAGCARCQAVTADLQRLRANLRASDPHYPAPEALRRKIAERLATHAGDTEASFMPEAPRRGGGWLQRGASFGLGAAMAAAIALFVVMPEQKNLVEDVVASHVRSLQAAHLQDVASSDQHTVKPWFDGKLDFAPPVKDFKDQGFPLEGGRLDVLDGRPVAALVYGRAKHQINVFVWPAHDHGVPDREQTARNGYNVIHFVRDGMNVWVVSDVEKTDLALFARLWEATP